MHKCTEVRFACFFSGGFITATVVNPPESKLAKRTYVKWFDAQLDQKILDVLLPIHPLQQLQIRHVVPRGALGARVPSDFGMTVNSLSQPEGADYAHKSQVTP